MEAKRMSKVLTETHPSLKSFLYYADDNKRNIFQQYAHFTHAVRKYTVDKAVLKEKIDKLFNIDNYNCKSKLCSIDKNLIFKELGLED